jgi:hypothetical protein
MKGRLRTILVILVVFLSTSAQKPGLSRVMDQKLDHAKAILGAVVTSNWATLDRESRALAMATRDPAWLVLTAPDYLQQSDAFQRALQDLIGASAKRDLEAASAAEVALTTSCVKCHQYVARKRIAGLLQPPGSSARDQRAALRSNLNFSMR